ncbi:MAG: hypothetical protein MHM6MM_000115 [Cercozoa sp. M6MM]
MATWGALCSFLLRGEYQGKRILNQNVFLSLSLRDDVTMRVIRLMCAANFLLVAVVVAFFAREYLVSLVQALRSALSPLSLTLANANSSFADTRTMPKRVFVASTFVLTAVLYALCLSPLPSDAINDLFGLLCGVALGLFFPVALYISVHRVPLQKAALSFALCTAFGVGVLGLALGFVLRVRAARSVAPSVSSVWAAGLIARAKIRALRGLWAALIAALSASEAVVQYTARGIVCATWPSGQHSEKSTVQLCQKPPF